MFISSFSSFSFPFPNENGEGMGIGSFVLEEIGRNKRKWRLFLFLFPLLKREDEREKIEKNANQKHFPQKNSIILFFERQKFVKMSENSKNNGF